MTAKRKPVSQRAQSEERKKSVQAFKTAVPLIITTALLILVYILVLRPVTPINALRSAFTNTFNTEKQKSLRYDGSFGTDANRIKAEFNGQKSSSGDESFSIQVTHADTATATLDYGKVSGTGYVNIGGTNAIPTIVAAIPGAKPFDSDMQQALVSIDDKWIALTADEQTLVVGSLDCSEQVGRLFNMNASEEDEFPFEMAGGPYSNNDGSAAQTYEVKLKKNRKVSSTEQAIIDALNCLDSLRGDDYRLREVNNDDMDAFRLKISVDPLSNTVRRIEYKQFGNYFQIFLRDFNKDVTVTVPPNPITLNEALNLIPIEIRLKLLQSTTL